MSRQTEVGGDGVPGPGQEKHGTLKGQYVDWNRWGRSCRGPQEVKLQGEAWSGRLESLDFVLRVRHGVL